MIHFWGVHQTTLMEMRVEMIEHNENVEIDFFIQDTDKMLFKYKYHIEN